MERILRAVGGCIAVMRRTSPLERLGPIFRRQLAWGELYHARQDLGRAFVPSSLNGYFNDLTAKTRHRGPLDAHGLPLLTGPGGSPFYHPVGLCQWGLGHHDAWLLSQNKIHREQFLRAADWLVENQDANGGWAAFDMGTGSASAAPRIGIPSGWHASALPYSALAQGQAISLLVRARSCAGPGVYEAATDSAWKLLKTRVEEGGVCEYTPDGPRFAEVPGDNKGLILNGWIFALFGVWDYWLSTRDTSVIGFFERCYAALASGLGEFDLAWWSAYDLEGNVAKPFYHHLHVAQLTALSMIRVNRAVSAMATHWAEVTTPGNALKAWSVYLLQRYRRLVRD